MDLDKLSLLYCTVTVNRWVGDFGLIACDHSLLSALKLVSQLDSGALLLPLLLLPICSLLARPAATLSQNR